MVRVDTERCRSGGSRRRSCTTQSRLALTRRKVGPKQPPSNSQRWFRRPPPPDPLRWDQERLQGSCGAFQEAMYRASPLRASCGLSGPLRSS
eukprot:3937276-Prymnesium_polylepis.1